MRLTTPSTDPLSLRTLIGIVGYMPGMEHPALLASVVRAAPAGTMQLEQFDDALAACGFRLPAGAQPVSDLPEIDRLIRFTAEILRGAGHLPLEGGRHLRSDSRQGVHWIALPAIPPHFDAPSHVLQWLARAFSKVMRGDPIADLSRTLEVLSNRLQSSRPKGMNTSRFLLAAREAGIPTQHVAGNVYQFGWGARARWLDSSFTDVTPSIGTSLARNKVDTAAVLRRARIPVADHSLADGETHAVAIARRLGYPVVVKPADLDGGRGVSCFLRSEDAVRQAFRTAIALSKLVLVEKHVDGNDYRLQVFQSDVFWAVQRIPGGVTADGRHDVTELLAALNAHPLRGEPGSTSLLKRIALDDEARDLLTEQSLTPLSVPERGRFVRLRRAANVASGGVPDPVLDRVHPDNAALAVRAARALRLDLAGIDVLMPDISRSWLETGASICEVNAQPQMSPHLPAYLLGRLVRGQGRIPTVMHVGADPARSEWRVSQLSGRVPGSLGRSATDGLYVGDEKIALCSDSFASARALLGDTRVEAAYLDVHDTRMISRGCPVDRLDLLVFDGPLHPNATPAHWNECAALARILCPRAACVLVDESSLPWRRIMPTLGRTDIEVRRGEELWDRVCATLRAGAT